ncbi:EamA family transporter [Flavihumibacter sp. R14]|nr:EamA family transporter [Flavihumibacter soli]
MSDVNHKKYPWLIAGILFSVLWASASTATKIGLTTAQPLTIALVRFTIASALMLFISHVLQGNRLPSGKEWKQLSIYGLLNISIYLGCYVIAMERVTAGIGSLAVATNPVFISFLSVFLLKRPLTLQSLVALAICSGGVICAAWPLLSEASVTAPGLMILLLSMLSYSLASIYFSSQSWNDLHLFTINGWQTLLGGIFLLPVTWFYYQDAENDFTYSFWGAVLWLAIPVSIVAVLLWLWLIRISAIRAGFWLFLCPVFGYAIAAVLMNDRIDEYTITGVAMVITGLLLSQRSKKNIRSAKQLRD